MKSKQIIIVLIVSSTNLKTKQDVNVSKIN